MTPAAGTMTRRILSTFDRATASDLEAGATWFHEAGELARTLGESSGRGTEHAAAVISHLSPQTTWGRNVTGAVALLTCGARADGILRANFDRAVASLDSADPGGSFGPRAPKTRHFYANILGDTEAVTVDVWAARVAGVDERTLRLSGAYDSVERAYRSAARRRGVTPATMQATTWVVARNGRAA